MNDVELMADTMEASEERRRAGHRRMQAIVDEATAEAILRAYRIENGKLQVLYDLEWRDVCWRTYTDFISVRHELSNQQLEDLIAKIKRGEVEFQDPTSIHRGWSDG